MQKADFTVQTKTSVARILQLTDTQVIDSSKRRYPERISQSEIDFWAPENKEERLYSIIRNTVQKAQPDLIVITGDFTYGEFDDDGQSCKELTDFMDSLCIPWTLCYGNHEKEAACGVEAQCRMWEESAYCLYRRQNYVDGDLLEADGTFSIDLQHEGEHLARIYMMDSGCGYEEHPAGIFVNQQRWLAQQSNQSGYQLCFMHIPPICFDEAAKLYGYSEEDFHPFEIPANNNGDFGYTGFRMRKEWYIDRDGSFFELCKKLKIDGICVGHIHRNNTSIGYQGVRLTYGLKTGEYDSHPDVTGGTLYELGAKKQCFNVTHITER